MMTGSVNADGEAVVSLRVRDADGGFLEIDAIVDTGFNGLIALPTHFISDLQLPYVGVAQVRYGDGSEGTLPVHEAVIEWDGFERLVRIDCLANEVLLGTALLAGHELRITFADDGVVEITRLK